MLKIKKGRYGTRLDPVTAKVVAFMIVDQAMEKEGLVYEVSSGLEGEHMPGSLHYIGNAWDWTVRSWVSITIERGSLSGTIGARLKRMVADVRNRVGDDFDVVWKPTKKRLHLEFQPKKSFGRL